VASAQNEVERSFPQVASDLPEARRSLLDRCLIGIVATLTVAVVRWWLDPILGSVAAFAIFYTAIIFTAWFSGFWPALFVMALGWCLASYLFDSSRGTLAVYPFRNQVACAVYVVVGVYLAYLIDRLTRDIARRRQVESDLRASQEQLQLHQSELAHMSRLSIMGEMAASLAHELNQPLHAAKNYARGSIRRLLKNPECDAELLAVLERIGEEADRAAEILHRVRDFVQKTGPHISALSVNDLVQEAVPIINLELKRRRARIVCELAPDTGPVRADPIQIEQVVVNLARNGLESMHDSPEEQRILSIGTRRCDERTVEVFVRDRGKGISEQEMKKIFEPFFTTKTEGMGMGLAISRSIVQAHEGRLWVTANDDRGCTFHFTLPVAGEAVSKPPAGSDGR
jgi:C4-dicarboxylate-specific signal transduction histidine kinase